MTTNCRSHPQADINELPSNKLRNVRRRAEYKSPRCGVCYWALYDGDWCQNPECKMYGKSVNENRIYLTNGEAQVLIDAKGKAQTPQNKT